MVNLAKETQAAVKVLFRVLPRGSAAPGAGGPGGDSAGLQTQRACARCTASMRLKAPAREQVTTGSFQELVRGRARFTHRAEGLSTGPHGLSLPASPALDSAGGQQLTVMAWAAADRSISPCPPAHTAPTSRTCSRWACLRTCCACSPCGGAVSFPTALGRTAGTGTSTGHRHLGPSDATRENAREPEILALILSKPQ